MILKGKGMRMVALPKRNHKDPVSIIHVIASKSNSHHALQVNQGIFIERVDPIAK
jgi:hypothetical protein